jgi:phospholipid-binding lipoprotein MlaA
LPFFGPSSVRDGVGVAVDWFTDPVILIDNEWLRWGMRALDIVDTRADLLYASRVLEQAALDPYSFIRDAYLQRRQDLVYDGNPPAE